jgi:hypothetical protein
VKRCAKDLTTGFLVMMEFFTNVVNSDCLLQFDMGDVLIDGLSTGLGKIKNLKGCIRNQSDFLLGRFQVEASSKAYGQPTIAAKMRWVPQIPFEV